MTHPQIFRTPRKHRTSTFSPLPPKLSLSDKAKRGIFHFSKKSGFNDSSCGFQFYFSGCVEKNVILANALNSFHQTKPSEKFNKVNYFFLVNWKKTGNHHHGSGAVRQIRENTTLLRVGMNPTPGIFKL